MCAAQPKPEPAAPPADEPRRGWVAAAVVALGIAVGAAVFTEIYNYDIFWHLASGDWMLAHGRVLGTDPFSIDPLPQWVNVHWLFQVIISALYAVGGFSALVGLKTVLAIATIVVFALACRRDAPVAWIALAGLLAVVANSLLGDLLLNAGRVDVAREAYGRAGEKAAWRIVLCDWVKGLFVGAHEMPARSPAQATRYEAMVRRILGIKAPTP